METVHSFHILYILSDWCRYMQLPVYIVLHVFMENFHLIHIKITYIYR